LRQGRSADILVRSRAELMMALERLSVTISYYIAADKNVRAAVDTLFVQAFTTRLLPKTSTIICLQNSQSGII